MNRKKEIEREVPENEVKNEIKVKTKFWHECRHCSRQHRTKIKENKVFE